MATNLNILQSSVEVSSAEDSIVITNNNTGNVVNVTGTDVTTVEVSSAGLLGNPGRDSDVLLGNSVYFANITASGNISASGTLSIPGFPNVSSSLASAVGSGADNLGNHTATQDLNLDGNSIFGILHTTASGNISASGTIVSLNLKEQKLAFTDGLNYNTILSGSVDRLYIGDVEEQQSGLRFDINDTINTVTLESQGSPGNALFNVQGNISASGTLKAGLNSVAQTEIVYYNTSTGELTYGPINNLDGFIFDGGTF